MNKLTMACLGLFLCAFLSAQSQTSSKNDQVQNSKSAGSLVNDLCSGAVPIICGESISGTTVGSTLENPDPGFCGTSAGTSNGGGVWYKYTGVSSAYPDAAPGSIGDSLIVSICNDAGATPGSAAYDSKLRVYSGSCGTFTCVAGNDDGLGCAALSSIVRFNTVVGVDYFILVHGYGGAVGSFSISIDCFEMSTCPKPAFLQVLEVGDHTATVSWTEMGTADGWKVQYGPEGHDPNDIFQGTWFSTFGPSTFTFPDLDSQTTYDFYVQSNCINPFEDSQWAGPVKFRTTGNYCEGNFVDSGTETSAYQDNESQEYIICPSNAGDTVSLTFTFVDIEVTPVGFGIQDGCYDFLTIYNGMSAASPVLAQTLCGEEFISGEVPSIPSSLLSPGDTFISTDASGCLTVVFTSDASVVNEGWVAEVNCLAGPCQAPTNMDVVEIGFGTSNPRVNGTWNNPEITSNCQVRGGRISAATAGTTTPAFANINNTQIVSQTNGSTLNFNIGLYNNPNIPFTIGQTYGYEVRCTCADQAGYSDWSGITLGSTFVVPTAPAGMQVANALTKSFAEVGMSLYPNPNDGNSLFLSFEEGTEERFVIRVMDARGALVMEQEFNGAVKGSQISLEFQNQLSSGMYMLQALKGDVSLQERFIVR